MSFHSTNYRSSDVDFKTAIIQGQALDKGLYMPNQIPHLSSQQIRELKEKTFIEIAEQILSKVIGDSIPKANLKDIIKNALNIKIPIEKIQALDYICYLSKGPTCSFKDFGARMLARLMEYFLSLEKKEIIILTATSGDTGSAVAQAFYKMHHIKVIILYPKYEISDLQRKQMTTLGENIYALGINKKFDICQHFAKKAFSDNRLSELNLSSANSINFGRLIPQSLYYFWSYSRVIDNEEEDVIFSVRSGNFGNLTAGILANKMGLPVKKFIAAVNENDEFPKYLKSGIYKKIAPSKNCISNAMNVGHPSNLVRIIDLYRGHMDENGIILKQPDLNKIRKKIISYSINDNLTKQTIINYYKKFKKIIEPHGAVGWAALQKLREDSINRNHYKAIVFETADAAKFPDEIESLIGKKPKIPHSLRVINNKKEILYPCNINTYQDFMKFLRKKFIE